MDFDLYHALWIHFCLYFFSGISLPFKTLACLSLQHYGVHDVWIVAFLLLKLFVVMVAGVIASLPPLSTVPSTFRSHPIPCLDSYFHQPRILVDAAEELVTTTLSPISLLVWVLCTLFRLQSSFFNP